MVVVRWVIVIGMISSSYKLQAQEINHQEASQILDELRKIRQLLERQNALPSTGTTVPNKSLTKIKVQLDSGLSIGAEDAPLIMVEYTDYDCPFCRTFHRTTFSELKKNFIDTGRLRFFSRDMPLDIHPDAMHGAEAARCANEQGRFWALRDQLSTEGKPLDSANVAQSAVAIGLEPLAFTKCLESGKFRQSIEQDKREALDIGVNGTPTFLIGKRTPDGIEGEIVTGALPYRMFEDKLRAFEGK